MRVSEYMTPDPITVSPRTSALEAAEHLYSGGFRHLPVLEDGVLVGMVSDRDLRGLSPLAGHVHLRPSHTGRAPTLEAVEAALGAVSVGSLMSHTVQTVPDDAPIRQAALTLAERGVGAFPVLRQGQLVGIFTTRDLLRWVLDLTRVR